MNEFLSPEDQIKKDRETIGSLNDAAQKVGAENFLDARKASAEGMRMIREAAAQADATEIEDMVQKTKELLESLESKRHRE